MIRITLSMIQQSDVALQISNVEDRSSFQANPEMFLEKK
jgi:hypothetical protein